MSFEANKLPEFEHKISDLPDQPNMQPNELKAYFDSSPEQLRQAHNGLCDALTEATSSTSAAAALGFQRTAGVPADNVQDAIEDVQAQLTDAVLGNIPSGSVTGDKLAQDVRDRFTAIETAAATEVTNRTSADNNLQNQINTHTNQISSLTSGKAEFVMGTYSGNDEYERTISLGFTPKAVILSDRAGRMESLNYATGGIVTASNNPSGGALKICTGGFQVCYSDASRILTNSSSSNYSPFGYIAFK